MMEEDDENDDNMESTFCSSPKKLQRMPSGFSANVDPSSHAKMTAYGSTTSASVSGNDGGDRPRFEQYYEYGDPEDAELSPALGPAYAIDYSEEESEENGDEAISQCIPSEVSLDGDGESSTTRKANAENLDRLNHGVELTDVDFIDHGVNFVSQMSKNHDFFISPEADSDASSIEDSTIHGQGRRGSSRGIYRGRNSERATNQRSDATTAAKRGRGGVKRGWRRVLERMGSPDTQESQSHGHRRGRGRGRPPGSSCTGRSPRRGRKRGARAIAEPSREFKKLQSEATQAFIGHGDMERALVIARKAVQINPEIYAAHSLLSEVLWTMGRKEDSIGALFSGAHTRRDPKIWWNVANRTMELIANTSEKEAREGFIVQAIYCLTMVLKLDSDDNDARMERMRLRLEIGSSSRAKKDCEKLLEAFPHNTGLLRQLVELCLTNEEMARAKILYDGVIENVIAGKLKEEDSFTWSFINIYLDLLDHLELWDEALHKLSQLSRLLLEREAETFWDKVDDDREWDVEDYPRRSEIVDFAPGKFDLVTYGLGLPLELRIKLGLFRLKIGTQYYNEALGHFDFLDPENPENTLVLDYDDLFKDVADALRDHRYYAPALRFYTALRRSSGTPKNTYFPSMALCFRSLGLLDELEKCYKELIEDNNKNYEALVQLAKLYEEQARNDDYLNIVSQLQVAGKRRLLDLEPPFVEPPSNEERSIAATDNARVHYANRGSDYVNFNNLREDNERIVQLSENQLSTSQRLEKAKMDDQAVRATYRRLRELKDATNDFDADALSQWISAATYLIHDLDNYGHRDTQLLRRVQRARQEKLGITETLAHDLSLQEDASFRDISFDEWLNIICEYATFLAQWGDGEGCWKAITKATEFSPFYQNRVRSHEIYICMIVCAIKLGNEDLLQSAVRWFVKTYGYSSSVYNFYTAAHHAYGGIRPRTAYNSGPSQKFMLRQLKSIDWVVMSSESPRASHFADLEKKLYSRREEEHVASGEPLPDRHLPSALSAYAHMLASGGSYAAALTYYHRAYTLTPNDPILNLCIAITFAQHALKRQSENRLVQIQIGASFLKRYRDLRSSSICSEGGQKESARRRNVAVVDRNEVHDSAHRQVLLLREEIEFNEGRFWHMLGLMHLAIPAYGRCLEAGRSRKNIESFDLFADDRHNIYDFADSNVNNDAKEIGGHQQANKERNDITAFLTGPGYAEEAAFALQLILVLNGDLQSAERITEEWLVI